MELPISTIVIIVIVLIVLLAIIAFFFGVWDPGVGGISLEAAKNNACQMLISTGCGDDLSIIVVNGFDANKDETIKPGTAWSGSCGSGEDNLAALCECWYNLDETDCKEDVCHCD